MNPKQSFGSYFKNERLFGGRNGFRESRKKSIIGSLTSYLENNMRSKFEAFSDQNNNFLPPNNGSCRCSPLPCAKSCSYNCQCSQRCKTSPHFYNFLAFCHEESRNACQQRCCNKSSAMPNFNQAPGPSSNNTNNWFDFYQSSSPTPIYNFNPSPYVASPGPAFSYAMQPVMQYTTSMPAQQQAPCPVVPVAPVQSASTSQNGTSSEVPKENYG